MLLNVNQCFIRNVMYYSDTYYVFIITPANELYIIVQSVNGQPQLFQDSNVTIIKINWHILKQRIALNEHTDWLLKLRIIPLLFTSEQFARNLRTKNFNVVIIFAGINELKSSLCAILSHCFSKTTIHRSGSG